MTFLSLNFILFLLVICLLYYLLPKKTQWIILIIASLVFYLSIGLASLIAIIIETAICFICAKYVRNKKGLLFTISIILIVLMFAIKLIPPTFISILGMSYYTLMLVGYMIDVQRETIECETNFAKLLLFAGFFPAIIQGPISRYSNLMPQLMAEHKFNSQNVFDGIVRFAWGAFKKMVIANRISVFMSSIAIHDKAAGSIVLLNLILMVPELYADFSGYTDMALGISQILGITLPENFKQPLFARSVSEFWRRWHITLSSWMKDYIYYPIVMSSQAKHFLKNGGKEQKKSRTKIISCVAMLILWIFMGIWHGTGLKFVILGLYCALIFIITFLLEPISKKFDNNHKKLTANPIWKFWQQFRTFLLMWFAFIMIGISSLSKFGNYVMRIFTDFRIEKIFDGGLLKYDLSIPQWILLIIGLAAMLAVSIIEYNTKESIVKIIAKQKLPVRILIYWFIIIMIMFSLSVQNTEFVYAQF